MRLELLIRAVALGLALSLSALGAWAMDETSTSGDPKEPSPEAAEKELCALIEQAAKDHDLPVGFFTRLIWKESSFRSDAVSPKGAQGIAQFMPYTAAERDLLDPFDARLAIPAAADLLADLKVRFGNLGLAAAAYNAGAARVTNWLAEATTLPLETQDYVLAITGLAAETWAAPEGGAEMPDEAEGQDCLALAALLKGSGRGALARDRNGERPLGRAGRGQFFAGARHLRLCRAAEALSRAARGASADDRVGPDARPRHARLLPDARAHAEPRRGEPFLRRAEGGGRRLHRAQDLIERLLRPAERIASVSAASICWLKRSR